MARDMSNSRHDCLLDFCFTCCSSLSMDLTESQYRGVLSPLPSATRALLGSGDTTSMG